MFEFAKQENLESSKWDSKDGWVHSIEADRVSRVGI